MSHWQVHVTFGNGAAMVFGVEADSAGEAEERALTVQDAAGLRADCQAGISPIARSSWQPYCQGCGRSPAGYCWAWNLVLCEMCRVLRTDREIADGGRQPG